MELTFPSVAIDAVIENNLSTLRQPGVLSVRAGYAFANGWITDRPAIIVTVGADRAGRGSALPAELDGFPVEIRPASALKIRVLAGDLDAVRPTPDGGVIARFAREWNLSGEHPELVESTLPAASARPNLPYTAPRNMPLNDVTGTISIRLSASPDSGWPTLKPFIAATQSSLTVGLYDFTSAHILAAFESSLVQKKVALVLDHPARNPTADQSGEQTVSALRGAFGAQFSQAWALDRTDPFATAWIFPSAYHIKVAVRDSSALWLSSGNLNNSNQPDIEPVTVPGDATAARSGDRDWHVIIEHPGLSETFEAYIQNDLAVASAHNAVPGAVPQLNESIQSRLQTPPYSQFFAAKSISEPMRITPLLTPDAGVYLTAVVALIASARTSLYLQFQYIELPPTPGATSQALVALVAAVIERQKAGIDVRIIMSQFESAGYLEQLQAAGLDVLTGVKLQNNVHNKGIVVDSAAVLISSQNWSSAGVFTNRDAGVIIHNESAAQYFQQIFLHDWNTLSQQKANFD